MNKKAQKLDFFRLQEDNKKKIAFINHYSKGKKLLDLGSTSDALLTQLENCAGFSVNSIPSTTEKTIYKKRKAIKTKSGRLQHIFSKEKYDAITVFNFNCQRFKNYWELENMLRTCSKRIETGGVLILDALKPQNFSENSSFEISKNHKIQVVECGKKKRKTKIKHTYVFNKQELFNELGMDENGNKTTNETQLLGATHNNDKSIEAINCSSNTIVKNANKRNANLAKAEPYIMEISEKLKILSLQKLIRIADIWNMELVSVSKNFEINEEFPEFSDKEERLNFEDEKINNAECYMQLVFKKREIKHREKGKKREKKKVVTKRGKIKEVTTSSFVIIMAAVCVVSVLLGTKIGSYYVMNFLVKPDYGSYTEDALRDDPSKIFVSGKKPNALTPLNSFVYAESKMQDIGNWSCVKDGVIQNTFANQTVKGECSYQNNIITQSSVSLGFKNVASKTVVQAGENNLQFFNGTPDKSGNVIWDAPQEKNMESYRADWGVSPEQFWGYIVSSKTLQSATEWQTVGSLHTATLNLNVVSSVILYVKQMEKMSGLGAPTFEYIKITYTMDDKFRFTSIDIEEKYVVSVGIKVTCVGVLSYEFTYTD